MHIKEKCPWVIIYQTWVLVDKGFIILLSSTCLKYRLIKIWRRLLSYHASKAPCDTYTPTLPGVLPCSSHPLALPFVLPVHQAQAYLWAFSLPAYSAWSSFPQRLSSVLFQTAGLPHTYLSFSSPYCGFLLSTYHNLKYFLFVYCLCPYKSRLQEGKCIVCIPSAKNRSHRYSINICWKMNEGPFLHCWIHPVKRLALPFLIRIALRSVSWLKGSNSDLRECPPRTWRTGTCSVTTGGPRQAPAGWKAHTKD